ncbi:28S ribosomal protein S14, mitochondrial [Aplysia californica]|uniref:28S ribosomal protein S14, mitochondrial n=1 Tax=Aplysia californica TaxID=6500 RepID=A0ABM0JU24_APLCA|nr:28S ribosomal protein S14, mitochondrial [Aplysia californica]
MFGILSRVVAAGGNQVSQLAEATCSAFLRRLPLSPTTTTATIQPAGVNTSVVNTVVPCRGKRFDHHFVNRWMARDYKRRVCLKQHFSSRLRYTVIKRCSVLPKEFQEVAGQELHAFPRDACYPRIKPRCILTSRPRWVLHDYRLSRIQWRLLADYNKLSGIKRATW